MGPVFTYLNVCLPRPVYLVAVFLASVAVVLGGSLSRRVDVSVALGLGALLYGALALGGGVVGATVDAFNFSMFNVLVSLVFAMAVSGFRTVLVKRLPRVFEADAVALGVETQSPVEVDDVLSLVHLMPTGPTSLRKFDSWSNWRMSLACCSAETASIWSVSVPLWDAGAGAVIALPCRQFTAFPGTPTR